MSGTGLAALPSIEEAKDRFLRGAEQQVKLIDTVSRDKTIIRSEHIGKLISNNLQTLFSAIKGCTAEAAKKLDSLIGIIGAPQDANFAARSFRMNSTHVGRFLKSNTNEQWHTWQYCDAEAKDQQRLHALIATSSVLPGTEKERYVGNIVEIREWMKEQIITSADDSRKVFLEILSAQGGPFAAQNYNVDTVSR